VDSQTPHDDARASDRARQSDDADSRTGSWRSWSREPDTAFAHLPRRAPREAAWLGHADERAGDWDGRSTRVDTRSGDEDPPPDEVNCRTDDANNRTAHRAEEIPEMA